MICKKIDFYDQELEENVKGYSIFSEDEIVIIFERYKKRGYKKFNNLNELIAEIIHLKEMNDITEEILDSETKRADELERLIKEIENK